jgi:pimeloyl-ACP methyl ester carboxylesterase
VDFEVRRQLTESWYGFKSTYVLVREQSVGSRQQRKPPIQIVFLHGLFEDSASWDALSARLYPQMNVLSLEFPGFGRSLHLHENQMTLDELIELTVEVCRDRISKSEAEGGRWVLAGHGFGGLIAQLASVLLSAHLPRLDLVLINPMTFSQWPFGHGRGFFARRLRALKTRARLAALLEKSPMLQKKLHSQLTPPKSKTITRIAASWPNLEDKDRWTVRMKEFSGSTLILWGASDPVERGFRKQDLLSLYRDVEYYEHAEGGHWLALEDPDWVSDKVKSFLFRTEFSRKAV